MNKLASLFQKRAENTAIKVSHDTMGYLINHLDVSAEALFAQFGSIDQYYVRARSNNDSLTVGLIIACVGTTLISASMPLIVAETLLPVVRSLKYAWDVKTLIAADIAIDYLETARTALSPYFLATAIPGPLLFLSGAGLAGHAALDQWRLHRKICKNSPKSLMT